MYGDLHARYVLYKEHPDPGHRYRQIFVVEAEQSHFALYILEGDVIQPDPAFIADSQDAEVYFHSNLASAVKEADAEANTSVATGWKLYDHQK